MREGGGGGGPAGDQSFRGFLSGPQMVGFTRHRTSCSVWPRRHCNLSIIDACLGGCLCFIGFHLSPFMCLLYCRLPHNNSVLRGPYPDTEYSNAALSVC